MHPAYCMVKRAGLYVFLRFEKILERVQIGVDLLPAMRPAQKESLKLGRGDIKAPRKHKGEIPGESLGYRRRGPRSNPRAVLS